ncbi:MAG TPA: PAS domain-containing protein [Candidatus Acidoferrum sp.]|nr:PAS domain-containing protein [Candidatus Acidoferrum sp.]
MRLFFVTDLAPPAPSFAEGLEQVGCVLCGVGRPEDGTAERIAATRADLLLLDLGGRDHSEGAAMARELRRQFDLPVVLMITDGQSPESRVAEEPFSVVMASSDGRSLGIVLRGAVERHRLERQLREANERAASAEANEARLAFLIANSPAVIFTCEAGGEFRELYMSPNVRTLFGYAPEDFVNDPGFWERQVHPDDLAGALAAVSGVLEQGRQVHEYRFRAKSGEWRWMRDELTLVRGPDGKPQEIVGVWRDVTRRREAERELRDLNATLEQRIEQRTAALAASERHLLRAQRLAGVGHWLWSGPPGEVFSAGKAEYSENAAAIFGVPPAALVVPDAEYIQRFVHPDDRERVRAAFADHRERRRKKIPLEYRIVRPDGGVRTIVETSEVVVGDDDNPTEVIGTIHDITERKRIERVLQAVSTDLIALEGAAYFEAAAVRLSSLLGADIAFITQIDPLRPGELRTLAMSEDGVLVPNFSYRAAGTPSARVLEGQTHIVAEGIQEQYPTDRLLAEKRMEGYAAEPLFDQDGRPLGLLGVMSRRPIADPAIVAAILKLFGVATAAAMMRQQVHQRDVWLRAILENTPTQIVLKDRELRIIAASRNVTEERATSMAAAVGRTSRDFFPPEIAAIYEAADRKVLATGEPVDQEVEEVENGQTRYYHNVKFPLRDGSGAIIGIGSFTTDVTERRRLEDHLRNAAKMEAIGKLTGGMAHDFNNYLAVIIGNLDLLKERLTDDAVGAQLIEVALGGALRGKDLTQSLLAFSRSQPLDPQVIDVNRHLEAVATLLRRTLGEDIALTTALAPDLWPVRIDAAQLDSGIVNLANNARDAMPQGGALSIATRNVQVDEAYARLNGDMAFGDYVLIEVSDSGVGMPPEILAHVFEPFFSTKKPGHGTGLGLSMLYGFVKQSGGQIRIYSEVGLGTTVRVYLPRVVTAPAAGQGPASAVKPALPRGTETILLVEDNEDVRRTAVAQLTSLGYTVVEAENGEAALRLLGQPERHIDLLFTDIVMPGKPDGYELAELALERRPAIRVLLTSGFPGDSLSRQDRPGPHFSLLGKPYRRDELARAIRAAIEAAPQRSEDPPGAAGP